MEKFIITMLTLILTALGITGCTTSAKDDASMKINSAPILVTAVDVTKDALNQKIALTGTIQADKEVKVVSETSGKVIRLSVKIGDRIGKGSPIALVDNTLQNASFSAAKAKYYKAKKDLERYESLYKEKNLSESDLEMAKLNLHASEAELAAAQKQLDNTRITSPLNGYVADRYIEEGAVVDPGKEIATVVDLSTLKLRINFNEIDAYRVKTGDRVTVYTDVYPGEQFTGKISAIGYKADEARNFPVEITLPNSSKNPLRAGLTARIEIIPSQANTLIIPRTALSSNFKKPTIFVLNGQKADAREIVTGRENNDFVEVVSGLNLGEKVIVKGINNLKPGSPVQLVKNN
jgi:RND family efflux transporter MFP subunit